MKTFQIIYGIHPLIEAIKEKKIIKKLFFQKEINIKIGANYKKLLYLSKQMNIPVHFVSKHRFDHDQLKYKNHQGVFALLSPIKTFNIKNLLPTFYKQHKNPLLLVLDRITDVKNFGSIIRTAACSGVHSIIIPNKSTARINSDSIKTSSGALFKIPICKENNIQTTIRYLIKSGLQIISATEKSDISWYKIDFSGPTAIILGNEENGISSKYLKLSSYQVKIPLSIQGISSLNVSVVCGILLYEVFRQRKIKNQIESAVKN
ncbi:23S rRNA (guanosine(2251)-2'-O)-methyltransferase RlmB [Blattabacterium cuenoti]|uniref:23S rRNA (guanosine(2251)-2'-O)-methyltransferase RlmB n=1 Tax=Blattabacterium cuenoti TaxID=1653831 RepID=UPI00163D0073|nr:23S rRNA (guanosine(2251)-2'-O)-methyltransferase RlmB [Blattabacterium cuenoti]